MLPPADREVAARARCPPCRRSRDAPAGTRLVWAAAASGDYPVFVGRGLIAAASSIPLDGRRFVVTDENVARHHAGRGRRADRRSWPGEEQKTIHARRAGAARARAEAGAERDDLVVAVGGGVVGDLGRLLRRRLPARHAPRAGAHDARGPGRLGVRRQDRRRPARGQELRGRLPPAVGGARATRPRSRRCRRRSWRPATRGGQDRADRGRGAVGARPRRAASRTTRSCSAACARSSRWSPRTSATAGGARCSTSATRSAHAIEAATGYARYRHGEAVGDRPAGRAAAVRPRRAARRGGRACSPRAGCRSRSTGAASDEVVALVERDKKRAGGRVPFVLVEAPGEVTHGHEVDAGDLRAAVEEVRARMKRPRRGDPRREPRRARSGATRRTTAGSRSTELEVQVKGFADELGLEPCVLADQPRGRVLRGAAPRADRPTG